MGLISFVLTGWSSCRRDGTTRKTGLRSWHARGYEALTEHGFDWSLGLGFTLKAALRELNESAEVVVAELVREVIDWNANPDYDLSAHAMSDARVHIVHDDVVNVLKVNERGFDAIMLDTDNGPDGMLMSENARLYDARGIALTIAALRTAGKVAYWSVSDDRKFVGALAFHGLDVKTERVRAHTTSGPMHTIYVATPHR